MLPHGNMNFRPKETPCFLPGSNRRPHPCEGCVITTTLRKLLYASKLLPEFTRITTKKLATITWCPSSHQVARSRGATDNASDYGSEDCRFESCRDRNFFFWPYFQINLDKMFAPPGGLEPPTFRLTAERASQLRHGGMLIFFLRIFGFEKV